MQDATVLPLPATAPVPRRAYVYSAVLALLILGAAFTGVQPTYVVFGVSAVLCTWATYRFFTQWHVMVSAIILIILIVPIGRYGLPITLPFQLEPYRALVMIVAIAWFASLLAEPNSVRLWPSGLAAPLAFLWIVIAVSIVANLGTIHARGVMTDVIFKVSFFLSYIIVMLLIGSVLRSRAELDRALKVLIGGGGFVAFFALVENKTGFNLFDHIGQVIPIFRFQSSGVPMFLESRGSGFRVYASAEHPIALGALMVMLLPVGVYVAWRNHRNKLWWGVVGLIAMAALATVARTAILMLFTEALFLVAVKPRVLKRVWWLVPPFLVAVNIAVPATFGTLRASFFPQGGLVAQQDTNSGGDSSNRVSDIGPSVQESKTTPWFGQGWGTRVPTKLDSSKTRRILDDQWLGLLLEIGIGGIFAWLWFFGRNVRLLTQAARRDDTEHGWLLAALAASIFSFAVGMYTYDAFGFPQATLMMFILAGIGIAARRLGPITEAERTV